MSQAVTLHGEYAFGIEAVVDEVTHEIFEIVATRSNPTLARLICIHAIHDLVMRDIDILNYLHYLFFWNPQTLNKGHFFLPLPRTVFLGTLSSNKTGAAKLFGLVISISSRSGRISAATRCAAIVEYFFDMSM